MPVFQDLSKFSVPTEFRGRSKVHVQLWWAVQATLFKKSPQFAYGFRRWLLRCFGAKVGVGVIIRPTATITYPWNLSLGDHAWVGDNAVLYNLGRIEIGDNAVISQMSHLCAGDHDYRLIDFPIRGRAIFVGAEAWIAADVFVAPGVKIGSGTVVGARSSVFQDLPANMVCLGSPCVPVKARKAP